MKKTPKKVKWWLCWQNWKPGYYPIIIISRARPELKRDGDFPDYYLSIEVCQRGRGLLNLKPRKSYVEPAEIQPYRIIKKGVRK